MTPKGSAKHSPALSPGSSMKKNFANMPITKTEPWRKLKLEEDACFKHIDKIESKYIFGKTLGQMPFGVVRLCKHI